MYEAHLKDKACVHLSILFDFPSLSVASQIYSFTLVETNMRKKCVLGVKFQQWMNTVHIWCSHDNLWQQDGMSWYVFLIVLLLKIAENTCAFYM